MIVFHSGLITGVIKKFPENFLKRKEIVTELIMETILWNTDQRKVKNPYSNDERFSYKLLYISIINFI